VTVFVDFDGTITRADVVDAILERYADAEWRRVEEEWQTGRIGSRECLRAQMALVRATEREIDSLLDAIDVDDGFAELLETCRRNDARVHILSDGFDYCIRRILGRSGREIARLLRDVGVCASHLEPGSDGRWSVEFPFSPHACTHGCATCKPAVIRLLSADEPGPTVFVGDGLSDRFAAAAADVLFAKDALAGYCVREHIVHSRYLDLRHVARSLEPMLLDPTIAPMAAGLFRGPR
jgi:2,3-diketo-5-methylthio-1-phosphopentane phosphatase